jgi:choline dehydrogenase-like flavoprotein
MKCIVVGSGPSGTNAALTLLRRGKPVELWDVGREEAVFPRPDVDFHGLKGALDDPQEYFLGPRFEALLPPGGRDLLRYPPARKFLLDANDALWPFAGDAFRPFASLSRGGLGVGWGVNAVSYDDDDMQGWPVSFADLREAYAEACRRVPIAGTDDRLSGCFPGVAVSQPPVRLNRHDTALLSGFERRAEAIERKHRITIGRARLAVVNSPDHPSACRYCGRCLWGCPHGSLYNPAETTLRECQSHAGFEYKPGRLVLDLSTREGLVTGIRYLDTASHQEGEEPCGAVFLAAGALQSGGIFLRTLQRDKGNAGGRPDKTRSVMDTTVVKIPYIRLGSVGVLEDEAQFQFNRLIAAHRKRRAEGWPTHCHGEILSLNTLLYHALIESIPLGSRQAMRRFARLQPALGVVTWFFPDKPVAGNGISILPDAGSPTGDRLHIHYREHEDKEAYIRQTVRDTQRALWTMGCIPWRPMRAPAGAGIHYAGTVPMGEGPLCSDSFGRANAYRNLYLCDGAAFPSLPSKSITLNLIAHAIRVASLAEV